jgi:hypothetical protein
VIRSELIGRNRGKIAPWIYKAKSSLRVGGSALEIGTSSHLRTCTLAFLSTIYGAQSFLRRRQLLSQSQNFFPCYGDRMFIIA